MMSGRDDEDDFNDTFPTGDGVLGGRDAYAGGGDDEETNEAFRVDDSPMPAYPAAGEPSWPLRVWSVYA
jgi:hypothetical protein